MHINRGKHGFIQNSVEYKLTNSYRHKHPKILNRGTFGSKYSLRATLTGLLQLFSLETNYFSATVVKLHAYEALTLNLKLACGLGTDLSNTMPNVGIYCRFSFFVLSHPDIKETNEG